MVTCNICFDSGYVEDKHGNKTICTCRLRSTWKSLLGHFANCGPVSNRTKYVVQQLIKEHPKDKPKHFYVKDRESLKGPTRPRRWWDKFIAYYLIKSNDFLSFKHFKFTVLVELFMEKGHGDDMFDDDIAGKFFKFPQKTFIIEATSSPASYKDRAIIDMFLDTYKDRNIFIFLGEDSKSAYSLAVRYENDRRETEKVEIRKGLYEMFDKGTYPTFQNLNTLYKVEKTI